MAQGQSSLTPFEAESLFSSPIDLRVDSKKVVCQSEKTVLLNLSHSRKISETNEKLHYEERKNLRNKLKILFESRLGSLTEPMRELINDLAVAANMEKEWVIDRVEESPKQVDIYKAFWKPTDLTLGQYEAAKAMSDWIDNHKTYCTNLRNGKKRIHWQPTDEPGDIPEIAKWRADLKRDKIINQLMNNGRKNFKME